MVVGHNQFVDLDGGASGPTCNLGHGGVPSLDSVALNLAQSAMTAHLSEFAELSAHTFLVGERGLTTRGIKAIIPNKRKIPESPSLDWTESLIREINSLFNGLGNSPHKPMIKLVFLPQKVR